ncbi:MAG: hypothetical protein J5925_02470 [Clostridia bacterium]|nr:hypothetical protein [Clostridia bacterium]
MSGLVFGKPEKSKQRVLVSQMESAAALAKKRAEADGFTYLDIAGEPFTIGGIAHPRDNGGEYFRLDPARRDEYSPANRGLAENTPGACVRFTTNSDRVSLRIALRAGCFGMHHFCDRGVYGVDAYVGTGTDRRYVGGQMQTFAENHDVNTGVLNLPSGAKEVMINLPLYAGITKMEIGFPKGTRVGKATERTVKPVAFYGSSITQGGCVSRPGSAYTNIICRALDADCRNFGFSGSAMGELVVADYIAHCELSCFVMDYDYNAPTVEHLAATHEPFFKHIRAIQPELPVVFVTHPYYSEPTETDLARVAVVKKTYENALAAGDKNVAFVDSALFFTKEMRDLYAVDYLHPNDLGQMDMAQKIFPAVKKFVVK